MHKRYMNACIWDEQKVTAKVKKRLDKITGWGRHCKLMVGRNDVFESIEGDQKYAINLVNNTYSYGYWEIGGIPYKHVSSALAHKLRSLKEKCDAYFSVLTYLITYHEIIFPLPMADLRPNEDEQIVMPSPLKRKPGWPKKNRKRQKGEEPTGTTRNRSSTVKCAIYKHYGHNKKSFQGSLVGENELISGKRDVSSGHRASTTGRGGGSIEMVGGSDGGKGRFVRGSIRFNERGGRSGRVGSRHITREGRRSNKSGDRSTRVAGRERRDRKIRRKGREGRGVSTTELQVTNFFFHFFNS